MTCSYAMIDRFTLARKNTPKTVNGRLDLRSTTNEHIRWWKFRISSRTKIVHKSWTLWLLIMDKVFTLSSSDNSICADFDADLEAPSRCKRIVTLNEHNTQWKPVRCSLWQPMEKKNTKIIMNKIYFQGRISTSQT